MPVKKNILILCPFPIGVAAGQRLKYEQYFDGWREQGYTIKISPFMSVNMWNTVYTHGNYTKKIYGTIVGYFRRVLDIFRVSNYSIIYVFMWVTPFGGSLFEKLVRMFSKYIIYDIEDNVMKKQISDHNKLVSYLRSPSKIKFLIKKSDYVISSSPSLNEYCCNLRGGLHSKYISSSVNTDLFVPSNNYSNENVVVIGWTGTFSSKQYLDTLRKVFIDLNKVCRFKLRVIGNFNYEFPGIDLEVIKWSSKTEIEDLQGIDIGVYPLIDDEWVSGKSGLKAIQYMAFGIPTVASNLGTTPKIIEHMDNGWLVNNEDEWVTALKTLVNESQLRKEMGVSAREKVLKCYSISVIKDQYLSVLDEAITGE